MLTYLGLLTQGPYKYINQWYSPKEKTSSAALTHAGFHVRHLATVTVACISTTSRMYINTYTYLYMHISVYTHNTICTQHI